MTQRPSPRLMQSPQQKALSFYCVARNSVRAGRNVCEADHKIAGDDTVIGERKAGRICAAERNHARKSTTSRIGRDRHGSTENQSFELHVVCPIVITGASQDDGDQYHKMLSDVVGFLQAYADDAEQAARAGLELVAAISTTGLRTRFGVATGLVVVGDLYGSGASGDQAIVGETPNLAAALFGIAEPNTWSLWRALVHVFST